MVHDYPTVATLADRPSLDDLRHRAVGSQRGLIASLERVYLFGAGGCGAHALGACRAAEIDVRGFVDNSEGKRRTGFNGLPVVSAEEAAASGVPIVITSVLYFNEMREQLQKLGAAGVTFYPCLTAFDEQRFPAEPVFAGLHADLAHNAERYLALFDRLDDDASRAVLEGVLKFRMTLDGSHLGRVFSRGHRHYFPPDVIALSDDEVFVDGGGYDGDTSSDFVEVSRGRFRRIYLFEPDPELLARARRRLSHEEERIRFVDRAVYSEETTLRFQPSGSEGCLDADGAIAVRATSIDAVLEEPATYIKLDIEGAEPHAIRGAADQIAQHRSRLAVSVYHTPSHLWQLPLQVQDIRDDYRVSMRHYSNSVADTVVFFT